MVAVHPAGPRCDDTKPDPPASRTSEDDMTRLSTSRSTLAAIALTGALVACAKHPASGQTCSARLVFPG